MHDLITLADGTDRAAWLAARSGPVITATQAAAIAGSHPYATLRDVWDEKTDPDYDRDANRNRWLDERAELGVAREGAIVEWAGQQLAIDFQPNTALVTRTGIETHAATPDAWGMMPARPTKTSHPALAKLLDEQTDGMTLSELRGRLVLAECKATQTRWDRRGLPQHIVDQGLWQHRVTGAALVVIAAEFYEWKGRGANRHAELVGTAMFLIVPGEHRARLDFLVDRVADFERMLAEGIAPETVLDLSAPPSIEWDDSEEEAADKAAALADLKAAEEHLLNMARLEDELAEKVAELDAEKAAVRALLKAYDGKRITIHGSRYTATLGRHWQAKKDTSKLDPRDLRRITTWQEVERLTFDRITTENTEEKTDEH